MKVQSAVEFMLTYAWAFIIIAIFVAVVFLIVGSKNVSSYTPSSCYIEPLIPCSTAILMTNTSSSNSAFIVSFYNDLGTPIVFSGSSLNVTPSLNGNHYYGTCYPANAPTGAQIVCSAILAGYAPSIGSQLNSIFTITYKICSPACSSYNTSGYTTIISTKYASILDSVTLMTNTSTGYVVVSGVPYPSNTLVDFISGVRYNVSAVPPKGGVFSGWSETGNVFVTGSSQNTAAYATGNGILTADFK